MIQEVHYCCCSIISDARKIFPVVVKHQQCSTGGNPGVWGLVGGSVVVGGWGVDEVGVGGWGCGGWEEVGEVLEGGLESGVRGMSLVL